MSTGIAVEKTEQGKPQLGDQMPDSSYYMGVSPDTGTDFYLFIEGTRQSKTADVETFNDGTDILRRKCTNNETFHGHKFSAFQLESEIIQAQKEGKADGGVRRPTTNEWEKQVESVFRVKPELRKAALEICINRSCVQSSSTYESCVALFIIFKENEQGISPGGYEAPACLLLGRSDPKPKVG